VIIGNCGKQNENFHTRQSDSAESIDFFTYLSSKTIVAMKLTLMAESEGSSSFSENTLYLTF